MKNLNESDIKVLATAVGRKNASYYEAKIRSYVEHKLGIWDWNWASFLFGWFWFLYRRVFWICLVYLLVFFPLVGIVLAEYGVPYAVSIYMVVRFFLLPMMANRIYISSIEKVYVRITRKTSSMEDVSKELRNRFLTLFEENEANPKLF